MEALFDKKTPRALHLVSPQATRDAIRQLLKAFPQLSISLDVENVVIESHYPFVAGSYSRNKIYQDEQCEIVLAIWDKHISCPVHNHGNSKCSFIMVSGELVEQKVITDRLEPTNAEICSHKCLKPGDYDFIDDINQFHFIENHTDEKSVSVHIYSPPIGEYETLDFNSKNK
ncbi:cysteine dioxygenase [Pseudoalteromonas sp. T1lg23B]|uniref:cysteine dioxygenase n=1 Tax=Pseudoalteromonas sp. T1lg23B TaxID=2077097 RepID=UPI000CF65B7D|nr:cysteine dioxygenase family protein [Pseudoalteromonas sp. T1lg23B]